MKEIKVSLFSPFYFFYEEFLENIYLMITTHEEA